MTRRARITVFFIAALLLALAGCAETPTRESATAYLDDATVTARVKTAIFNEPSLKVSEISVKTENKVVQLSGTVNSRAEMAKAVELARSVGGVRSVRNELRLKQ